jgi:hypothetical protein
MKRIYYIYFLIMHKFYKKFGEEEMPHIFSMTIISFFIILNILSITSFIEYLYFPYFNINTISTLLIIFATYLTNYFIFLYKGKSIYIIENVRENKRHIIRILTYVIILSYMIFSVYLFIYFGNKVRSLNLGI